jgi:hypothetical protein
MAKKPQRFLGIALSNIPYINLRFEFNELLALFRQERFRKQFRGYRGKAIPIKSPRFTWHGRREALLTYLLRDAIVAIECAVGGAVYVEAIARGVMTQELLNSIRNPFKLRGSSSADCVFNRLPAELSADLSLKTMDRPLWVETQQFYREIRNPIFHSQEISEADADPVWKALEFVWRLFGWLNSWHAVEKLASGPLRLTQPEALKTIPEPAPGAMNAIIPERELSPDPRENMDLGNVVQLPGIEEILGMSIGPGECVEFTMQTSGEEHVNLRFSAHAAMKLLACLALAHKQCGWEIPGRVF